MPTKQEQFLQAYEDHADEIFAYCYRHTKDRRQARELTQEIFQQAWIEFSSAKDAREVQLHPSSVVRVHTINP